METAREALQTRSKQRPENKLPGRQEGRIDTPLTTSELGDMPAAQSTCSRASSAERKRKVMHRIYRLPFVAAACIVSCNSDNQSGLQNSGSEASQSDSRQSEHGRHDNDRKSQEIDFENQTLERVIAGVNVRMETLDKQKGRATFKVGSSQEVFDTIRLQSGNQVFFWASASHWEEALATGTVPDALFPNGNSSADYGDDWNDDPSNTDFNQTGLQTSQHPFLSAPAGEELMVVTLDSAYAFIVDPLADADVDLDGRQDQTVRNLAAQSTCLPRSTWLRGLDEVGIGGTYQRLGQPMTVNGADADVLITHPKVVKNLHKASLDEMLDLLSGAEWLSPQVIWKPQALAKISATMHCEEAGASPEMILSKLRGRSWDWLREIMETDLTELRRKQLWQNIAAEIPERGDHREEPFADLFCDSLQSTDALIMEGRFHIAGRFIEQMCDRSDMARRESERCHASYARVED